MVRDDVVFGDPRLPKRFWSKVEIDPGSGCWLWTAANGGGGTGDYGRFYLDGKMYSAHRVSYRALVDRFLDIDLDHYRMNPGPRNAPCSRACVNPAHLEPVTHRENMLRGGTFSAENAKKTHCPQGHPYDEANTYTWRGNRHCRACRIRRR